MSHFLQVKVPNGKLLQLEKKENSFAITGDFFCYPESTIEDLEFILFSKKSDEMKKKELDKIFDDSQNNIIGFGVNDLWGLYSQIIS